MSKRQQKHKQLSFSFLHYPGLSPKTGKVSHGGEHTRGKRKEKRPFNPNEALHVVLRSSKAHGEHSMLRSQNCNHIRDLVNRVKDRYGVRVYRYANVGNHIHLLIRARSRKQWQGFIRELAGQIAMIVTGARKGHALPREKSVGGARSVGSAASAVRGFWDHLVYTRIVSWGKDFKRVAEYVLKNLWEGVGIPLRKLLDRGYRVAELSEDGFVLVSPDLLGRYPLL